MALEHSRLLAASLTAAVLGTACSTPTETAPPAPEQNPAPTSTTSALQDPQGLDRVSQDRRKALVDHLVENAQRLRANGDLRAAKLELLKAKELSPASDEVRTLLASVQAELGEPVGTVNTYQQQQQELQDIGRDRLRADVRTKLQKADDNIAARNYGGAIEELRLAALQIELKDDMDWQGLGQQVNAKKAEAEKLLDSQQRQSQAEQNAILSERLRHDYAEQQARKTAHVEALIIESQVAFEARQFQRAQDLAQQAMALDPNNSIAFEMHNASVKAARDTSNDNYFRDSALAMRKKMEADEELKIPQTDVLRMDATTWDKALGRAAKKSRTKSLDAQDLAVWKAVDTTPVGRLTYTEETGDFLEVVKNLKLITGVEIITTPKAREAITAENLKIVIEMVSSVTLNDFLNHLVNRSTKLGWTVKNGVVVIGDKQETAGTVSVETYPIQDLTFARHSFTPPKIQTIPGDAADDTPRTGGASEDPVKILEDDKLKELLINATSPTYWADTESGVSMEPKNGLLIVRATADMHAKLVRVLADMRRFQTPIVTIDSKFLTISRNFLQEIGIDFRGLGGAGNKGSTVSLDDVTNGLVSNSSRGLDNGGTSDPAANPLAGAFFNDGGDGDVRARTENYFGSDLGRVLTPTGGLTAGWTLIDDTQMSLILRAVEKRENGEIVNSQILSIVDNARGNVSVINQTAYVRDFDVEVAQAAFIADPKVDVIQDGLVLDVQPIILHDRKYILLNLNPTVAELQRPIPTFTTSLAGSTLPVTIQLPNLTVTNFATSVRVPDGGTVLLGGLRQALTKERRAEIPLLARLPLISFLFKQEGTADENRSLMVMVRAQITDVVNK